MVINHDHERISTAEYLQAARPNIRQKKRMQPGKGCIAKSFPASRQDHHAAAAPPQFCCVRLITMSYYWKGGTSGLRSTTRYPAHIANRSRRVHIDQKVEMVSILEGIRTARTRASYTIAGQMLTGLYNRSTGRLRLFGTSSALYQRYHGDRVTFLCHQFGLRLNLRSCALHSSRLPSPGNCYNSSTGF